MHECSCGETLTGFDIDREGRVSRRASVAATYFYSSAEDAVRFLAEEATVHDIVLGSGGEVVSAGRHLLLPATPEPCGEPDEPETHTCAWPTCEVTVTEWGLSCSRHVGGMTALTRICLEQLDRALSFEVYFANRPAS